MTDSVNQHGQVQPVGSVTEKIEGFFDLCRTRGLSGTQGVLIPSANRRHLMLRNGVEEAVRSGQFHIWTVEDVDALLQMLTGLPCGKPDTAGVHPEGSLHRLVSDRLAEFARTLRAVSADEMRKDQASSS